MALPGSEPCGAAPSRPRPGLLEELLAPPSAHGAVKALGLEALTLPWACSSAGPRCWRRPSRSGCGTVTSA